jgi:integrase
MPLQNVKAVPAEKAARRSRERERILSAFPGPLRPYAAMASKTALLKGGRTLLGMMALECSPVLSAEVLVDPDVVGRLWRRLTEHERARSVEFKNARTLLRRIVAGAAERAGVDGPTRACLRAAMPPRGTLGRRPKPLHPDVDAWYRDEHDRYSSKDPFYKAEAILRILRRHRPDLWAEDGSIRWELFDRNLARDLQGWVHADRGKPSVAQPYLSAFKALLVHLAAEDRVDRSVLDAFRRFTKLPPKAERYLPDEDVEKLAHEIAVHGTMEDKCVFALLDATGLRPSMVLGLDDRDVILRAGEERIRVRKGLKAGDEFVVRLNPEVADLLRLYVRHRPPTLDPDLPFFRSGRGNRHSAMTLVRSMRRHATKAGVTLPPRTATYFCRHRFITKGLVEGLDHAVVARLVGIRDLKTLARYVAESVFAKHEVAEGVAEHLLGGKD